MINFIEIVKSIISNHKNKANHNLNITKNNKDSENKKISKIKQRDNSTAIIGDQTNIQNPTINIYPSNNKSKENDNEDIDVLGKILEILKPIYINYSDTGMIGCIDLVEFENKTRELASYEMNLNNIIKDSNINEYQVNLKNSFIELWNFIKIHLDGRTKRIFVEKVYKEEADHKYLKFRDSYENAFNFYKNYKIKNINT